MAQIVCIARRTIARQDPNSKHAVPALGKVSTRIAAAAIECGAAKRAKLNLHETTLQVCEKTLPGPPLGEGPSGQKESLPCLVQSSTSDAQETDRRPSIQDCDGVRSTIAPEKCSTTGEGTHSGKVQRRRLHCTHRKRAGTHRHYPCTLQGTFHISIALGNTKKDMAALATRCTAITSTQSQPKRQRRRLLHPANLGLAEDVWELLAMWATGCGRDEVTAACHNRQEKKRKGLLSMRGFRPTTVLQAIVRFNSEILQSLAGPALKSRRCPQYGHFPGRQAHDVVFILRRLVKQATEWQIPIFVTDCDVAAASDHVSHHVIPNAMEAMNVLPLLLAAWLRECKGSDTFIKLDDIMTPWIRRTRSAPQGDLCAADLFGAVWEIPAATPFEMCR